MRRLIHITLNVVTAACAIVVITNSENQGARNIFTFLGFFSGFTSLLLLARNDDDPLVIEIKKTRLSALGPVSLVVDLVAMLASAYNGWYVLAVAWVFSFLAVMRIHDYNK